MTNENQKTKDENEDFIVKKHSKLVIEVAPADVGNIKD